MPVDVPLDPLIDAYARHHYAYNNICEDRRRQQPRMLQSFVEFIAPTPLNEVQARHLRDFLSMRLESGTAPSTVRRDLNMVRPFLAWLYAEGIIGADVMLAVREVRAPRGSSVIVPRPYRTKEIRRFWDEFEEAYPWARDRNERERGEFWLNRYRRGSSPWKRVVPYARRLQAEAIVTLALHGGLRLDEIHRLELDHMDPDNEYVIVNGARKNAAGVHTLRAVPWIVPQMRDAVREWLEFRAEIEPEHDRPWLTLRPTHRALDPLQFKVYERVLAFGEWEMHRMRHTAATEMLRGGWKLEHVQKILGHSRLEMTLKYAQIVEDDLVRANYRNQESMGAAAAHARDKEAA